MMDEETRRSGRPEGAEAVAVAREAGFAMLVLLLPTGEAMLIWIGLGAHSQKRASDSIGEAESQPNSVY